MKKYCNAYYQLYPCANTHVLSELNSSQLLSGDFSWKGVIELSSAKVQKILGMTRAGKISGFVSCFMCVIRMEPGCLLSLRHWTLTRVSGCYCFMSGTWAHCRVLQTMLQTSSLPAALPSPVSSQQLPCNLDDPHNFSKQRLLKTCKKQAICCNKSLESQFSLTVSFVEVNYWSEKSWEVSDVGVGGKSHNQNLSNFMYKILCSDDSFNTFYCLTITICIFYIVSHHTALALWGLLAWNLRKKRK